MSFLYEKEDPTDRTQFLRDPTTHIAYPVQPSVASAQAVFLLRIYYVLTRFLVKQSLDVV